MVRAEKSIEIEAPISECYRLWAFFEGYPRFIRHIQRVQQTDKNRWHWEAQSPQGKRLEWDVIVDVMELNKTLSWHSTPESPVNIRWTLHFTESERHWTLIKAEAEYIPPSPDKSASEFTADMFRDLDGLVEDVLICFDGLMRMQPAGVRSQGGLAQEGNIMGSPKGSVSSIESGPLSTTRLEPQTSTEEKQE